ncbi:GNAT family N-acetyltransferase [Mucilaginibacter sp.]|uniref:GNAT family N-acetyltransferase n=1 Tax=Mucilaginibacter sp. TaxID=1882438 RepID=UPI003D0A868F
MIRNAMITDAAAIRLLLDQLDYPTEDGFVAGKLPEMMAHPDQELLVYQQGEDVAGFVSLHFVPQIGLQGAFAIICYFAIDKAYRSKGIGAKLEAHCIQLAKQRKCDRIQVHCHIRREDAHRFYERQGFKETRKYFTKDLKTS